MPEDTQWLRYASRFRACPATLALPEEAPALVICIPVYAEPHLAVTLDSLWANDPVNGRVEVILLFNTSTRMSTEERMLHQEAWSSCIEWVRQHPSPWLTFLPVYVDPMPEPKGGVGWARKLALDTAAMRLHPDGIMLCLDADCTVQKQYIGSVLDFFRRHPACEAASIYFEHPLEGLPDDTREKIAQYELHLRYLVQAMRWTGHPFAYHTVGSSMAVSRSAYLKHGGMNTRQAGEDFYFLQKFIEVGTLREIHTTTVFPSPRMSTRVPFGTGRAMLEMENDEEHRMTTSMEVFALVRPLFTHLGLIRSYILGHPDESLEALCTKQPQLSPHLISFLSENEFDRQCKSIVKHTSSEDAFIKRFFRYFNAFRMIKYMHYMRDHGFQEIPVTDAVAACCRVMHIQVPPGESAENYLQLFRSWDRGIRRPT